MQRKWISSLALHSAIFILIVRAQAQYDQGVSRLSILVNGSYTTSAKLFPSPDAPDEDARSQYLALNGIFGIGASVQYHLPGYNVTFGVSAEYMEKIAENSPLSHLREGFRFSPIELTTYLQIPIRNERIRLFMGGGVGFYFGWRIYGQSESIPVSKAYGIHVVGGMDYFLTEHFFLRGEMKFRDPQFDTTNRSPGYGAYPIHGRINIDGITFNLYGGFAL